MVENWSSDNSPGRKEVLVWRQAYQKRLEQVAQGLRQIREAGEPEEAEQGIGDITMCETHQVQSQLEQSTQHMMHAVKACKKEKEIIEDKFVSVR